MANSDDSKLKKIKKKNNSNTLLRSDGSKRKSSKNRKVRQKRYDIVKSEDGDAGIIGSLGSAEEGNVSEFSGNSKRDEKGVSAGKGGVGGIVDNLVAAEDGKGRKLSGNKKGMKRKKNGVSSVGGVGEGEVGGVVEKKVSKKRKLRMKEKKKLTASVVDMSEADGGECGGTFDEKDGKPKKGKKKNKGRPKEKANELMEKKGQTDEVEVYCISAVDEDCSKGMKKWIKEYHDSRPGLKILEQRIDDFIVAHEARLEEENKEKKALAEEEGWTVVEHHKGRKKTTDAETGITVGSVAKAVVEDKMAKKKNKGVGLQFYQFQKKEAKRNEILAIQSRFEQDKKRIEQLRAARKFRPY